DRFVARSASCTKISTFRFVLISTSYEREPTPCTKVQGQGTKMSERQIYEECGFSRAGPVNRACRISLARKIERRKRRPSVIVWTKRFWTLCFRLATSRPHINHGTIVRGSYRRKMRIARNVDA